MNGCFVTSTGLHHDTTNNSQLRSQTNESQHFQYQNFNNLGKKDVLKHVKAEIQTPRGKTRGTIDNAPRESPVEKETHCTDDNTPSSNPQQRVDTLRQTIEIFATGK